MQNNDCNDSDKGASEKTSKPKSSTPQHEESKGQPAEQKTVGIGMPASEVEMERLKEKAKKMDK